jgi:hypothetical protein
MPAMIRSFLLVLSLTAMTLGITSCKERETTVSKSPDGGVIIFERRKAGAGPAPDSVKAFLAAVTSPHSQGAVPVFEGQDVGRVCYDWPKPDELDVRISGGYVDSVASQWQGPDGRHIKIRYGGTTGCVWHQAG